METANLQTYPLNLNKLTPRDITTLADAMDTVIDIADILNMIVYSANDADKLAEVFTDELKLIPKASED